MTIENRSKFALAILAAFICGGCGGPAKSDDHPEPVSKPVQIDGYKGVKLGTSFEEIMRTMGGRRFYPGAVRDCVRDLAIKGCLLTSDSDAPPFEMVGGIPYRIDLSFNRLDHLTDIDLVYDREEKISKAECLSIHDRTIDWLSRLYGPFSPPRDTGARLTAAKTPYEYTELGGGFIASMLPLNSQDGRRVPNSERASRSADSRNVSMFSHFVVAGPNLVSCGVSVRFSEPENIERRKDD